MPSEINRPAPGASVVGGDFHKDAFAAYLFPKSGDRRCERQEIRSNTHGSDCLHSVAVDYGTGREEVRPSRFRQAVHVYLKKKEGAPPTAYATALMRSSASAPSLSHDAYEIVAAATAAGALAATMADHQVAPQDDYVDDARSAGGSSMGSAGGITMAPTSRYYPHPVHARGVLKMTERRAMDSGLDPNMPGYKCPFWEAEVHRFGKVASHPEARPRTPTRSLRWRSDDAWANAGNHGAYKVNHIVPRRSRDVGA